jgi:hypothetical protein
MMETIYEDEHSNPFELEIPDDLYSPSKVIVVTSPLLPPNFARLSAHSKQLCLLMGHE